MTITNRLTRRTRAVEGGIGVFVGKFFLTGAGGNEGVLNGGTHATLTLTSELSVPLTVSVWMRATSNGDLVERVFPAPLIVPPSEKGILLLGPEDLAAYEVAVYGQAASDGDVTVDWTVTR